MLRRVIHNSVWALALAGFTACIGSCQDEDIVKRSGVEEGIPVTLQLNAHPSIPGEVMVQTRAVTDPEYRVNDLVVLVFNTNTGELKDREVFRTSNNTLTGQSDASGTLTGSVSINTTSGAVTVYAIANTILRPSEYVPEGQTATTEGSVLYKEVMAVNSLDDLQAITAQLAETNANAIDRIAATRYILSGSLAGTLSSDGTFTETSSGETTTEIPLYRTDSEIRMNIAAGADSKCTSFTLLSYRVFRVPNRTSLVPLYGTDGTTRRNYDTGNEQADDYFNVSSVQASENSISFYVPENIKQAKNTSLTDYHQRDLREKEADGKNKVDESGNAVFQYAPGNGTYVVLHGLYEGTGNTTQTVTTGGTSNGDGTTNIGMRATVDYIIHLGDFGTSMDDFSNRRNVRYTYNVTVKGVDNIVVEVETEGNPENQPGAEGEVFFQDGTYFDIDCHNEAIVLTFTKEEIENGRYNADQNDFTYRINSPFGTEDDSWLKFLPNAKDGDGNYVKTLQPYPGDDDPDLWTLQDLVENLAAIKNNPADSRADASGGLTVTCFVNEYVYTGETATQLGIADWGDYVNQTNREAYIFGDIRSSADQASSTIHTKYIISQRAIQTMDAFYAGIGLGVETLNETGNLPMGNPGTKPTDSEKGRANTLGMLGGLSQASSAAWGYVLDNSDTNYTYAEAGENGNGADIVAPEGTTYRYAVPNDYAYAAYACLMRNRDENGNGTIDDDEIHWYLPSLDQYAAIYVGVEALATEARLYSELAYERKHYLTSTWGTRSQSGTSNETPWIIWAEEGFSTQSMPFGSSSDMDDSGDWLTERERPYRCIRNLGDESDVEGINRTPFYGTSVNTDGNSVIAFNHLNDGVFRTRMVGGELEPHNELSTANKLYGAFAVAKDYVKGEEDPGGGEDPDPGTDPDPEPEPEPGDEPLLDNPAWPFYTWSSETLANLAADTENWTDGGDYYYSSTAEGDKCTLSANGTLIEELDGLAFARTNGDALTNRVRIMKDGSLLINNNNIVVTVLGCTAEDVISIEFASEDNSEAGFSVDNATLTSGSLTTVARTVSTFTVTADGDVSFTTTDRVYIYAIDRAFAGEASANAAPYYLKAPIHRAPTVKNGYQIWTASEVRTLPSICHTYSEKSDGSDAGTWRLPNQRELMMMLTAGIIGGPDDTAAAAAVEVHCQTTYSFHNDGSTKQYYSMQYDKSGSIMRVGVDDVKGLVRCVKDVDPQTGN